MAVKYLVTPEKGRVGRARHIKPFEVEAGDRVGDLDKVMSQITLNIGKIAKRRGCSASYELKPNESFIYTIIVWSAEDILATCTVEVLED